jgi:hypothetical protein
MWAVFVLYTEILTYCRICGILTKGNARGQAMVPLMIDVNLLASHPSLMAGKLKLLSDLAALRDDLKRQGYTHYLTVIPRSNGIGDEVARWWLLKGGVYFKGTPPDFNILREGLLEEAAPVVVRWKFTWKGAFIDGEQAAGGMLSPQDISGWIGFFKSTPGRVRTINVLI